MYTWQYVRVYIYTYMYMYGSASKMTAIGLSAGTRLSELQRCGASHPHVLETSAVAPMLHMRMYKGFQHEILMFTSTHMGVPQNQRLLIWTRDTDSKIPFTAHPSPPLASCQYVNDEKAQFPQAPLRRRERAVESSQKLFRVSFLDGGPLGVNLVKNQARLVPRC